MYTNILLNPFVTLAHSDHLSLVLPLSTSKKTPLILIIPKYGVCQYFDLANVPGGVWRPCRSQHCQMSGNPSACSFQPDGDI